MSPIIAEPIVPEKLLPNGLQPSMGLKDTDEVDVVVDWREGLKGQFIISKPAGYFDKYPLGEGNPVIRRIVRMTLAEAVAQGFEEWQERPDPEDAEAAPLVEKVKKYRLDDAVIEAAIDTVESSPLQNIRRLQTVQVKPTSDAEFQEWTEFHDTRQNSTETVGTGKTHATIGDAITASSSGDCIAVYAGGAANVYAENVDFGGKNLQLIGLIANQGIEITAGAGTVVDGTGTESGLIQNFEIDGQGGATYGVWGPEHGMVRDCVAHDCTNGIYIGYCTNIIAFNCIAYDCTTGITSPTIVYQGMVVHCTAVDCTTGITGVGAGDLGCFFCLACDNTTDFANADATYCGWNVSSDATAPGTPNSQSTFTNADFTDYAGNDFSLGTTTTAAKFEGYGMTPLDFQRNARKNSTDGSTNYVYAGASDPDPAGTATITGTFTIANHATQNCITATLSSLTPGTADYFIFAARSGSAPSPQASYIMGLCGIGETTWNLFTDENSDWIKDAAAIYIDVGVVSNATGALTWLGDPQSVTPWGYIEKAD